jgi:hypothetical protein
LGAEAKRKTQQKRSEASAAKKSASRKSTQWQQKRRGKKRAVPPPYSSISEDDDVMSLVETDDEDSDDDAQCFVCDNFLSNDKHGETWAQCSKCRRWCIQFAVETSVLVTAMFVTFAWMDKFLKPC